MGMRLVARSVNQDDLTAYHLFYADAIGTPGTDLTFFDWSMPREKRGTNSVIRTTMRVSGMESLEYWRERLTELNVTHGGIIERDSRAQIDLEDPEGQRLALIDDGGKGDPSTPWDRSTVPAEHQIRGLGPIVMSVPDLRPTDSVLTRVMEMNHVRTYDDGSHSVHVYQMKGEGQHAELHVAVEPDVPRGRLGAGGVHHVAFRTPNESEYHAWTDRLNSFGVANSGEIDRFYFRSLYFREPGHVLFEIATDGPGFGVDQDLATLGEKVILPPFLESHRESIVANLKPLD